MLKSIEKKLKAKHPTGSITSGLRTYEDCSITLSYAQENKSTKSVTYTVSLYPSGPTIHVRNSFSDLLKARTRLDVTQEDIETVYSIVEEIADGVALWETYLPDIEEKLWSVSPLNYNLWKNCIWEESDESSGISTLAVSYDRMSNKFIFYYNPDFIIKACAVQYFYDRRNYSSLEECYLYNTLFMIIHEMSHITRAHLQNTDKTMLDGVHPQDVNIYGDSYINMSIPEILKPLDNRTNKGSEREMLVIGITEELIRGGTSKGLEPSEINEILTKFIKDLNIEGYADANIAIGVTTGIPAGKDAILKVEFSKSPLQTGIKNSNLFIRAMDDIFKAFLTEPPRDSDDQTGDGPGEDQDGDGQNESSVKKQQKHIKEQQDRITKEKQESEEQAESESDDPAEDSKGVEDQIKDAIQKAQNSARRQSKDSNKSKEEVEDSIKKDIEAQLGQSLSAFGMQSSSTVGSWKAQLRKLVANATGIKEIWDANSPNARIQGQFGREVEVPAIKSITLMFDRSGSMTMEKFKEVLQETVTMFANMNTSGLVVHVVYWGETGKQSYKKFKYSKDLVQKIKASAPSYGSNDLQDALLFTKNTVKKSDLVMVFSDYQYVIYSEIKPEVAQFYRRIKKQTIFVSTKDGKVDELLRLDPTARNKFIRPR